MTSYFAQQNHMRTIARAAKERDWGTIDRVLEELRLRGDPRVMRGFRDALGEDTLPALSAPALLTIHDVVPGTVEIVGRTEIFGGWIEPKKAA